MSVKGEKSSGLSTPALAVMGVSQNENGVNCIDTPLPTFTWVPLHKAPCRSLEPVQHERFRTNSGPDRRPGDTRPS